MISKLRQLCPQKETCAAHAESVAIGHERPRPEGRPKDSLPSDSRPSDLSVIVSSMECSVGRERVPARLQPGEEQNLD